MILDRDSANGIRLIDFSKIGDQAFSYTGISSIQFSPPHAADIGEYVFSLNQYL